MSILAEPLAKYRCRLGTRQTIPGEDVRILRTGDGGFLAACDCSAEPLAETHEQPHESKAHLSYIDGRKISADDWVALEDLADGWYDVDPSESVEGYSGTYQERRESFASRMREQAESPDVDPMFNSLDEQRRHEEAREVPCPDCGANAGRKCVRPGGHRVRKCHADRVESADLEDDVTESDRDEGTDSERQLMLSRF